MSWKHAVDRFSLDPGWQTCKGCDCDFGRSVRFVDGLCPDCAAKAEAGCDEEEEMADAQERENKENENER